MDRPNIVFVLMDDMGWRDLSCYGSTFYETPNIDSLARDGMLFTDAYAACPVCSPTRASLLSGKYPATVGVTNWISYGTFHPQSGSFGRPGNALVDAPYIKYLPTEEYNLARALSDAGYHTWHVGKWHLGKPPYYPENHGFDVNIGGDWRGMLTNGFFSPYNIDTLPDGPDGEYLTDRLTDEAINLITEKTDDRPFFLNFWHYAVHIPIQAPADLVEKYVRKRAALGLDGIPEFEEGEFFPNETMKDQRVVRRLIQSYPVYAAMVENLDMNIGRLLGALREKGLDDNTIVIFTSDNGGLATAQGSPTTNLPLCEGKGWMYDGGVREPLLVKWPGRVTPGSVCQSPVTTPDFYPTILEMAGLPPMPEQHTDGVSLVPAFCGEPFERGAIYWHYPHYSAQGGAPGASVRQGDWKLIEFYETGCLELYNLRDDVGETIDLASAQPERVRELHGLLCAWRDGIEAKMPAVRV